MVTIKTSPVGTGVCLF